MRLNDKNCVEDDEISELPGTRTGEESEPIETFVDTPMDNHTRADCETRVRAWNDHEYAAVSIRVDIEAIAPLEVSLDADDARQLATELLTAAGEAESFADEWSSNE